jgi:ParB family chromosome partitioning protein
MTRKALGKGLRSLIPDTPPPAVLGTGASARTGGDLHHVDIDQIRPNREQPRRRFEQERLQELSESIRSKGMLQPVIVRPAASGGFELVAGERRWRAAQMAGLLKVPAIIRKTEDDQLLELALIENLQREGLNPIEEATAYQAMINELDLTQEDVAERVGKQRATIANVLRLLNLPEAVQELIKLGQLSPGHAKPLVALADSRSQIELAQRVIREGLSVRQVEALVAKAVKPAGVKRTGGGPEVDPNVEAAAEALTKAYGTKARIVPGRKGGRVEIHYYSDEELQRLYQMLMRGAKPR